METTANTTTATSGDKSLSKTRESMEPNEKANIATSKNDQQSKNLKDEHEQSTPEVVKNQWNATPDATGEGSPCGAEAMETIVGSEGELNRLVEQSDPTSEVEQPQAHSKFAQATQESSRDSPQQRVFATNFSGTDHQKPSTSAAAPNLENENQTEATTNVNTTRDRAPLYEEMLNMELGENEGYDECGCFDMASYPPFTAPQQEQHVESDSDAPNLFSIPQANLFDSPHPFHLPDDEIRVEEDIDQIDSNLLLAPNSNNTRFIQPTTDQTNHVRAC